MFGPRRGARQLARIFGEALALQQQGRLPEAERLYREVLRQDGDHTDAVYNLALIRLRTGDGEDAVRLLRKTLYRKPNFAEAHNAIAVALRGLNRPIEALGHFAKALAIRPDFAEAHNNLAATLQPLNRHDEALAHFERALALKPDLAEAHHGRGTALRTFGRLDEAQRAIERAIALAPRKAEFYRSLGELKAFAADDPHVALIEALARDIAVLSEEEQIHLHFALGKLYDDLGRHERAFGHLIAGNALKRKYIVYDEAAVLARFELTRELFGAEVMQSRQGQGHPSAVPVFIFGMPRSGTTLVEQILASHPQVYGAGELVDFETAVAGLGGPGGPPADVGGMELRRIGERYMERVGALAPAAARITDKMPVNFRFAGLIHLALPNARLIHTQPRPGRYLPVVFLDPVRRRPALHLRPRRARPLLPRLCGADGALAPSAAAGGHARSALRGCRRRCRTRGAPHRRPLRARMGRRVSRLPQNAAARPHRQLGPGAPADLPQLGRPLAPAGRDAAAIARCAGRKLTRDPVALNRLFPRKRKPEPAPGLSRGLPSNHRKPASRFRACEEIARGDGRGGST